MVQEPQDPGILSTPPSRPQCPRPLTRSCQRSRLTAEADFAPLLELGPVDRTDLAGDTIQAILTHAPEAVDTFRSIVNLSQALY